MNTVKYKNKVSRVEFNACRQWLLDEDSLHHETDRFFAVVCVSCHGTEHIIIDQPEVGILGFILTNGESKEWLVQYKPEPGNINYYNYAPTVQSTKSNYERVHGGKATPFLQHFLETDNLLVNVEGSEQGDRYLNKFNRNSKYIVEQKCYAHESDAQYLWIRSADLKLSLRKSFVVNTDARSVLASGAWYLLADGEPENIFLGNKYIPKKLATALNNSYLDLSSERLLNAEKLLEETNAKYKLDNIYVPFSEMKQYEVLPHGIYTNSDRVIGFFDVYMPEREICNWQQPLLERKEMQFCVLFYIEQNGIILFNVAAYPEIGFHSRIEFGPSLQSGKGIFKFNTKHQVKINDLLSKGSILAEIEQSDEGGRFYQNITRYTLAKWQFDPAELNPENSIWLSAADLECLSVKKGSLTNELRTTLSLLLSFA